MGNLDQVVYLRALAYVRGLKAGAIYRRIGADLHVIFDNHSANLAELDVASSTILRIAIATGANDSSRLYDDAISKLYALANAHMGVERALLTYLGIGA